MPDIRRLRRSAFVRSRVELVVDPTLLENTEIFFNAARLDRSIALHAADYAAIAEPRLELIAGAIPCEGGAT